MRTLTNLSAILVQQRYKLADPPRPEDFDISRRSISLQAREFDLPLWHSFLPDPDTPDNHIIDNIFGFGPGASIAQNGTMNSTGHQLTPGSSSLLKRVAPPIKYPCTPEDRSV